MTRRSTRSSKPACSAHQGARSSQAPSGASVTGRVAQDMKLSFKPYALKETGEYWFSSLNKDDPSKSRVLEWMIDHENLGAVTELDWNVGADTQVKAGLWLHNQQPPGPPVTQRKYLATAQGLKFDGWSVLADNERHRIISPHASWFKSFERVDVEAGLRVAELGRSSVRYEIGLFAPGQPLAAAQGHFVHVYVDRQTQRPVPLPAALLAALTPLQRLGGD